MLSPNNQIETGNESIEDIIKQLCESVLQLEDSNFLKKEEVSEILDDLKAKLKGLCAQEEEFNQNAALVPESDPNLSEIND